MKSSIKGLSFVFCLVAIHLQARGQSVLLMPEPLDGYTVSKAAIGDAEKPQGYLITAEKEGVVDKVQIVVEFRDFQDPRARVAAAKGYVNGFSQSLIQSGLKVAATEIPEITTNTVNKKIVADVAFVQPDQSAILTRHVIFFAKHGYDARVIATSKEGLQELSKWAMQIQPVGNLE